MTSALETNTASLPVASMVRATSVNADKNHIIVMYSILKYLFSMHTYYVISVGTILMVRIPGRRNQVGTYPQRDIIHGWTSYL